MATELERFAWPGGGGYNILYVFTQSSEHFVLCWECATKAVNGIEQGDENYDGYKKEGSYINWEGESSWCNDCGVELPSEYGNPDEQEPQVDAGELACEKTPTLAIPPEDDEWKKAMLPPYPLTEDEKTPTIVVEGNFPELELRVHDSLLKK